MARSPSFFLSMLIFRCDVLSLSSPIVHFSLPFRSNAACFNQSNIFTKDIEDAEELMTTLVDSIGYCLKCERARFVPIFERILHPMLRPLLEIGTGIFASGVGSLSL
jgi:hypothetical protein